MLVYMLLAFQILLHFWNVITLVLIINDLNTFRYRSLPTHKIWKYSFFTTTTTTAVFFFTNLYEIHQSSSYGIGQVCQSSWNSKSVYEWLCFLFWRKPDTFFFSVTMWGSAVDTLLVEEITLEFLGWSHEFILFEYCYLYYIKYGYWSEAFK